MFLGLIASFFEKNEGIFLLYNVEEKISGGKIMNLVQSESSLDVLQQYKERDIRYVLLMLRFRKSVRFLVYIESSKECAMESVEMEASRMRECFARIVKGRLAPCHLKDWLHDETVIVSV